MDADFVAKLIADNTMSREKPARAEIVAEMAAWVASGRKIIIANVGSAPKQVGHVIPAEIMGCPCRVVRISDAEEYIRESPTPVLAMMLLNSQPADQYLEVEAAD